MIEIVAHKKVFVTCPIQSPSKKVRRVWFFFYKTECRIWAGLGWFGLLWQFRIQFITMHLSSLDLLKDAKVTYVENIL
jgi:hypothetical protein